MADRVADDGIRKRTLITEIAPGQRTRPWLAALRPSLGDRGSRLDLPGGPRPDGLLRNEADQRRDALEDLDEGHAIEMLDQAEDVALGLGQGIEPAPALMDDDNDGLAAAIFDRLASAFREIDRESSLFEHRSTQHAIPQLFQFSSFHVLVGAPWRPPFLAFAFPAPRGAASGRREEQRRQGRDSGEASLAVAARKRHRRKEKGRLNEPAHSRRGHVRLTLAPKMTQTTP